MTRSCSVPTPTAVTAQVSGPGAVGAQKLLVPNLSLMGTSVSLGHSFQGPFCKIHCSRSLRAAVSTWRLTARQGQVQSKAKVVIHAQHAADRQG